MASKPLIIVESPAKAKTLGRFLGNKYRVEASFGHIRDLPESAAEVPKEIKEEEWGRLGVDINKEFRPYYVVPSDKKKQVDGAGAGGIETTVEGREVIFSGNVGESRVMALKHIMPDHPDASVFDLRTPERVVVGAPHETRSEPRG